MRPVTVYLAVLAILVQCLFVQAHVDFARASHTGAASASKSAIVAQATAGREDGAPASEVCVICREAALVSGAMPDAALGLVLLARRPLETANLIEAVASSVRLSHAWRSRAPPIRL